MLNRNRNLKLTALLYHVVPDSERTTTTIQRLQERNHEHTSENRNLQHYVCQVTDSKNTKTKTVFPSYIVFLFLYIISYSILSCHKICNFRYRCRHLMKIRRSDSCHDSNRLWNMNCARLFHAMLEIESQCKGTRISIWRSRSILVYIYITKLSTVLAALLCSALVLSQFGSCCSLTCEFQHTVM